ncbi:MAG: hypothetical protein IT287_01105, partial [Bdellovibrionaceae bacterium]|nr:hypothetical protein [Pseudobdellovibrionaceae bacterium]
LLRNGSLKKVDGGISLDQNPLVPSYNCLSVHQKYKPLPREQAKVCEGTQFTEAGAQIWGARITARYIEKNPPNNSLQALGLFAAGGLDTLMGKGPSQKVKDFNSMFLSEPAIQQALGCSPNAQQNCMSLFRPSGSVAQPTKVDSTGKIQ